MTDRTDYLSFFPVLVLNFCKQQCTLTNAFDEQQTALTDDEVVLPNAQGHNEKQSTRHTKATPFLCCVALAWKGHGFAIQSVLFFA